MADVDEHDPSLDDQPRPDVQDSRVLIDIVVAMNEDPDLFTEWERSFLRSIHRQISWTEKQCTVFDKLAKTFSEYME